MFNIKASVWLGSEKQVSYGILASATLHIYVDEKHIVDLREWKVRQTKNGIAALPPSRNAGPDKQNPGKDRYINYYSIFADDIDSYKRAQQTILDEYYTKKGGGEQSKPSGFPSTSQQSSTPSAPPFPSQTTTRSENAQAPTPSAPAAPSAPSAPSDAPNWPYGEM
jgi:hypothetical protein